LEPIKNKSRDDPRHLPQAPTLRQAPKLSSPSISLNGSRAKEATIEGSSGTT
jgi:hypothetical protein